jgi:hypothetical protein
MKRCRRTGAGSHTYKLTAERRMNVLRTVISIDWLLNRDLVVIIAYICFWTLYCSKTADKLLSVKFSQFVVCQSIYMISISCLFPSCLFIVWHLPINIPQWPNGGANILSTRHGAFHWEVVGHIETLNLYNRISFSFDNFAQLELIATKQYCTCSACLSAINHDRQFNGHCLVLFSVDAQFLCGKFQSHSYRNWIDDGKCSVHSRVDGSIMKMRISITLGSKKKIWITLGPDNGGQNLWLKWLLDKLPIELHLIFRVFLWFYTNSFENGSFFRGKDHF